MILVISCKSCRVPSSADRVAEEEHILYTPKSLDQEEGVRPGVRGWEVVGL
jgi:hypothetical protein